MFAIITTNSNALVSAIHDRMPVIISPEDYNRLGLIVVDPDPRDLLVPHPAEPMIMWPISTRGEQTRERGRCDFGSFDLAVTPVAAMAAVLYCRTRISIRSRSGPACTSPSLRTRPFSTSARPRSRRRCGT